MEIGEIDMEGRGAGSNGGLIPAIATFCLVYVVTLSVCACLRYVNIILNIYTKNMPECICTLILSNQI